MTDFSALLVAAARAIVAEADKSTGGKPAAAAAPGKPAAAAPGKPAAAPATGKPAAKAAAAPGKPAATPPSKPAAAPAKPVGQHSAEDVRKLIKQIGNTDGLGQQSARDILDEEAGVKAVSQIKPADIDKVYEAALVALQSVGAAPEGDAPTEDELDPTA